MDPAFPTINLAQLDGVSGGSFQDDVVGPALLGFGAGYVLGYAAKQVYRAGRYVATQVFGGGQPAPAPAAP